MSIRKSVVMLNGAEYTGVQKIVGNAIRADSFYGFTDGIHTVSATYNDFIGKLGLQGTLSLTPTESDWFYIDISPRNSRSPFVVFPEDPLHPTGSFGSGGDTGVKAFTFEGNFTYLRIVVSWEDIIIPPNPQMGRVDKVLLAM